MDGDTKEIVLSDSDEDDYAFVQEEVLCGVAKSGEWFMCDCGHDCCPCNQQCSMSS